MKEFFSSFFSSANIIEAIAVDSGRLNSCGMAMWPQKKMLLKFRI